MSHGLGWSFRLLTAFKTPREALESRQVVLMKKESDEQPWLGSQGLGLRASQWGGWQPSAASLPEIFCQVKPGTSVMLATL